MTSRSSWSVVVVAMVVMLAMALGAACKPGAPVAPSRPSLKLGPIDVDSGPVDLAALFPGMTSVLYLAPPQVQADDPAQDDTIRVQRGRRVVAMLALEGTRIVAIQLIDPSLRVSVGPQIGASMDDLAMAFPDARCQKDEFSLTCESKSAPGLLWTLDDDVDTDGAWARAEPIARIRRPAIIKDISWAAPAGSTLAVTARPTEVVGGVPPDDEDAVHFGE